MAEKVWYIKDNDLETIGGKENFEWVGCGESTGTPITSQTYTECTPEENPIYTNSLQFQSDIKSGKLVQGETAINDLEEGWSITPKSQRTNLAYYDQLDGELAAEHGITLIETPYGKTPGAIVNLDKSAAKSAPIVGIQSQFLERDPPAFVRFVDNTANALRAEDPNVIVLAGMATDASGVPDGLGEMVSEYKAIKGYVDGIDFNANKWGPPHGKGCAPLGCVATANAFFQEIGATSSNS